MEVIKQSANIMVLNNNTQSHTYQKGANIMVLVLIKERGNVTIATIRELSTRRSSMGLW